jgi:ribonuclease P protein component
VLQAFARGDTDPPRIGFTVTKKVGGAVVRNRARRRLREAARLELAEMALNQDPLTGFDVVLIGRQTTGARPFPALRADLRRALRKAQVI